jgi:hypothetical protein
MLSQRATAGMGERGLLPIRTMSVIKARHERRPGRAGLTGVGLAGCGGYDRVVKGLVGLRSLGIAGMVGGDRPAGRAGC